MSAMNLDGSTEVYQDFSFQLAIKDTRSLLDSLEQHTFPPWKIDPEWGEFVKSRLFEPVQVIAFSRSAEEVTAAVHLCIHGKQPEDWCIPNVVPQEMGTRLTVHEYNEIINEFVNLILMPASRPFMVKIELSPRKLRLNDLMSERSAQALRAFLAYGGGVAVAPHPSDEQRLHQFIWSLYENDPDFVPDHFHQWLEEGCSWPKELAADLAKRVYDGLALLNGRPRHIPAA